MRGLYYIAILYFFLCIFSWTGCTKEEICIFVNGHNQSDTLSSNVPVGNDKFLIDFSPYLYSLASSQPGSLSPIATGRYISVYAYHNNDLTALVDYYSAKAGTLSPYNSRPMYLIPGEYMFYATGINDLDKQPPRFSSGKTGNITNGIDYIYWNSHTPQQITAPYNYNMHLTHCCAQIVIKVTTSDNVVFNKINSATLTVPDTKNSSWNLFTGTITPATSLSGESASMGITNNYAQSIIVPLVYSGTLTLTMNITLNSESTGRDYTALLPVTDQRLKAGESYLYTITVNENQIIPSTVSVIDWITVINGNPIIPTPI